jgi:glycosyltransferase involved in cell wall biosynthesis
MRIAYLTNSSDVSGVGHRAKKIDGVITRMVKEMRLVHFCLDGRRGLLSKEGRPIAWVKQWPGLLGSKSVSWVRLGKKLKRYVGNKEKEPYDLFHATNQTLSWLVSNLHPMVVTVHDLIELTEPQDQRAKLLNRYLLNGIEKADHIIAVSNYTAGQVKEHFNIGEDKITVAHNGVGRGFSRIENFSESVANFEIRRELKISKEAKVVLFVGSDHPRKNVIGALEVFRQVKEEYGEVIFLKVGEPGISLEREKLLKTMDELNIREAVRLVGSVSDDRLNEIYILGDVLLYPSRN